MVNNSINTNVIPGADVKANADLIKAKALSKAMDMENVFSLEKVKESKKEKFLEKFEKIKSETVKNELENIFEKINIQSEKIGDKVYLKDILEYKKLVKEFLQVATSNSHQFANENFLDRRGRYRSYSLVKTVDRELDSLTRDFVNGQIDHIGVLKKMDDIKGMLLDIMM